MKIRGWFLVVVATMAALVQSRSASTQTVPADDRYFVGDLGTLGGGQSDASGINERGQVAGSSRRSDGTTHATFFDGVTLRDLGTIGGRDSAATDLNRLGDVVGWSLSAIGNTKGFIYSGGVRRSLGTLGGSNSAAYGINQAGDVVGSATTVNNAATRAFLYRNGTMKSLGTLGGTNSVATSINENGEIAGWSSMAGNAARHAFLFRDGRMIDLGTLGTSSEALGIGDGSDVVGRSVVASGATHAFLYSGGTMSDLGTLGGRNSEASGVNGSLQVVGTSEIAGAAGTHAFISQSGVMTDLNTRLRPGSGWVLETATAINFVGEIAGVGRINGQHHAYRLMLPVRLGLFQGGSLTQTDSNVPRNGVQVGRNIEFVTSVIADPNAQNIVFTDTLEGPLAIQSVQSYRGFPCTVSGKVVTCRIPMLGPGSSFEDEIRVIAKVTAPGVFSHRAQATADNADPAVVSTDTETNTGIALKSFTLSASTVAGGKAVSARAELTSIAPPGGAVVHLESSNPAIAPVPAPFVVQQPTAVRTFNIVPPVVSEPTTVTVSATYGLVTISQTLTVLPPALSVVSLTRSTMIGACQTATAKVTLTGSAPAGGARVALSSTTPGVHIPSTITIAPGQTTASLTVSANAVHALSKGVFTAAFGGVTKDLPLAVRPIYLTAVTVTPSSVTGGATATGAATIECAAPAGGVPATVTSTNPSAATPASGSLVFAAGSTTASFTVRTHPVAATTTPAIRVTVNGVAKSAALEVRP
jgi:probable HAF family extracellular repeat protein